MNVKYVENFRALIIFQCNKFNRNNIRLPHPKSLPLHQMKCGEKSLTLV